MNGTNRLSASLEDYLEAIYHSRDDKKMARSKQIQKRLGVSGASVTEACQQLREKGLINYAPYEAITLTPDGEKHAQDVIFRHETLKAFFIEVLKVDPTTADEGACKMEHVVSLTIVDRMIKYTKYLRLEKEEALLAGEESFSSFLEDPKGD
ncbi:MAG: DtxR family transcriptional regulator [Desulfotalea sp.]|nr:MAG: DtxR family transcriptional regulator [Desulfotalea sp.]